MANLQKIKTIATEKNISMKQLSITVGITPQGLSKIMRDGTTAISTLEKISSVLGVSPAVFFDSVQGYASAYGTNSTAINGSGNITIPLSVLEQLEAKDARIKELTDKLLDLSYQYAALTR